MFLGMRPVVMAAMAWRRLVQLSVVRFSSDRPALGVAPLWHAAQWLLMSEVGGAAALGEEGMGRGLVVIEVVVEGVAGGCDCSGRGGGAVWNCW